MHCLHWTSELMPELGANLDKQIKTAVVRAKFSSMWIHLILFVSKDKDWDRRNADRYLQPPIFQHYVFTQKSKKTLLFSAFIFICNVSLNMSKQIETQARHSHFFFFLPRKLISLSYFHTFQPYLLNKHRDSTGCVWCVTAPTPLCYMTKGPLTKGCKMLMSQSLMPDGAHAQLGQTR